MGAAPNVNEIVPFTIDAVVLAVLSEPLEAPRGSSSTPGGVEGWPETGHRGSRRLGCGSRHSIHETRPKVRAGSTLDLVRAAITISLGSMATGLSREWMSTPAKNGEGAWLLEAHAL